MERKEKIKELKVSIATANKELLEKLVSAKTDEEKAALKDELAVSKATRQGMEEELKLLKMNKTGSTHFEWHPHKGFNRRQAKQAKHSKRRNGATRSNKGQRIVGRRSN